MRRLGSATLGAVALLLLATDRADAYLDPGTGSMLLQGVVAGVAAGSVVLARYWARVRAFFSSSRQEPQSREETADRTQR